mmetsp:Transcript_1769/g.5606  ORF Transcript_1769/g.5606 Transcript_1769/m.5606 type:complete len:259 (+) Transcript_1769:3902-4678(+)
MLFARCTSSAPLYVAFAFINVPSFFPTRFTSSLNAFSFSRRLSSLRSSSKSNSSSKALGRPSSSSSERGCNSRSAARAKISLSKSRMPSRIHWSLSGSRFCTSSSSSSSFVSTTRSNASLNCKIAAISSALNVFAKSSSSKLSSSLLIKSFSNAISIPTVNFIPISNALCKSASVVFAITSIGYFLGASNFARASCAYAHREKRSVTESISFIIASSWMTMELSSSSSSFPAFDSAAGVLKFKLRKSFELRTSAGVRS